MNEGIGWIVDAAVSGYVDSIDRTRLREALRHRVNDGRIVRLRGKWLRAGGMEAGVLNHPDTGVVQGGTISPILAKIFLQQVLDAWFEHEGQPRLKGRSFLIRFADDGAPRARRRPKGPPERVTVQPMRDGPSESACRSRFQTPSGGCGQKPWS